MVDASELQSWLQATGMYSVVVNNTNVPARRTLNEALTLEPDDTRDITVLMSSKMLAEISLLGIVIAIRKEKRKIRSHSRNRHFPASLPITTLFWTPQFS